jgi:kynurenine formamidase
MTLAETLAKAKVYDLARPLEAATPTSPNHPPFRMGLIRRHGDMVRADGGSAANELFTMGGHTGTHIDALCHVSYEGRLHGGADASEASRGGRFTQLGVDAIEPMLCRAVLLNVPEYLGLETLEGGHAITAAELEATASQHGVDVGEGDAVFVRTGWPVGRYELPAAYVGHETGVPGPDESAALWLAERRIRVTGADTIAYERLAPGAGHALLPVHLILLVQHGIHIVEVLDLEALAADRVREFLLVLIPLKLVGATGSPVRPLALVA